MLLTEINNSITLRTGKMSRAQVEALSKNAASLYALLQSPFLDNGEHLFSRWTDILMKSRLKPDQWSKPLVHMDYEANPGVWIFDDSSGITFIVYSDEHRKNPWRGTSVDVVRPPKLVIDPSDDLSGEFVSKVITSAVNRFLDKILELSR